MEAKWDVIVTYVGSSLIKMGLGFFVFIPFAAIYLFGFWVLFLLGVHESDTFGGGTGYALALLYAFSIGLGATWSQQEEDKRRTAKIRKVKRSVTGAAGRGRANLLIDRQLFGG